MTNEFIAEEATVGPYTVKVVPDLMPGDPFEWEDWPETAGIDLSNHRDYRSPTYGNDLPVDLQELFHYLDEGKEYDGEERQACYRFTQQYYYRRVYLYDHGGRTVNTTGFSCGWDSGTAGLVYISKEDFKKSGLYGIKPDMKASDRQRLADQYLIGQVEELDHYMTGNIWEFKITDDLDEVVDNCCGFTGNSEDCLKEGIAAAQALLNQARKERLKQLKIAVKSKIPLTHRPKFLGARP